MLVYTLPLHLSANAQCSIQTFLRRGIPPKNCTFPKKCWANIVVLRMEQRHWDFVFSKFIYKNYLFIDGFIFSGRHCPGLAILLITIWLSWGHLGLRTLRRRKWRYIKMSFTPLYTQALVLPVIRRYRCRVYRLHFLHFNLIMTVSIRDATFNDYHRSIIVRAFKTF